MKKPKKVLRRRKNQIAPRQCYFCKEIKEPFFNDVEVLRRFLTERGKIMPRMRDGLCAKHQRGIALNIKYARHLALLPFVSRE